ncbi:unnamed protein product [Rotaria socialis]|uniref:HMG box domain-containing protein n=1 Tax=Rotaria socialis TaxID=392032 RepID=A0A818RBX7_9BILA|nr:unnamed protein product [Rotaria socialis]CAF4483135.1 unnamed protein product [Rotaria socialis]
MVKRSASKKSKQSCKTTKKSECSNKNVQTGGKRQPSGYLMFCSEQRTHRKSDFETMKPKEIMQYLGAEWRKLSPQQQESYKIKAPNKVHHDTSNKEEAKPQKCHTHTKSTSHQSEAKAKSNTLHNSTCSKNSSKKKENTKMKKNAHEKITSQKLAHRDEEAHQVDINLTD